MLREIVVYPDKRLKLISKEIESFDGALHDLLDDMYETMCARNGVGLAAIQVGVDMRALIINEPLDTEYGEGVEHSDQPKENTIEMINPVIIEKEGSEKFQEGCLSVPGFYEDIERFKYVKVEYFDRDGNKQTVESDAFLSIAIQHEMDHLDGKLFVEKLSILKQRNSKKSGKENKKRGESKLPVRSSHLQRV